MWTWAAAWASVVAVVAAAIYAWRARRAGARTAVELVEANAAESRARAAADKVLADAEAHVADVDRKALEEVKRDESLADWSRRHGSK